MDEKKNPFYMMTFLWEGHIMRQTKQNKGTLGVSLVVLGSLWGPLQLWACNIPILDLDEVGENKKTFFKRMSL